MKTLFKLFAIIALSASLLNASAFEKTAKFKTTKVVIISEKPLVVGNNNMELILTLAGKVPEGAKVTLKAFMPAMPGMPAMQSVTEAIPLGDGKYKVNVNFTMGGTWQIHIMVTPKTGKKIRLKSSVNI